MAEPVFLVTGISRKGEKAALLHFKDNTIKPVWTPDFELAQTLVGKPIPADWVRKDGEYGPQAFPPKKGGSGGAPAWRNTKEGFLAEQEGRQRWQQIEEERKDRRTALMTAAEVAKAFIAVDPTPKTSPRPGTVIGDLAETFYQWLRSSPAAGPAVTPTVGAATKGEDGDHGKPASASSPAGGTSLAEGEAAGTEPGEVVQSSLSASPGFTIKPRECSHRVQIDVTTVGGPPEYVDGDWAPTVQVGGQPRCSLCGTPAVKYKEAV